MEYKFTIKNLLKHIHTVCVHKKNVARYCFKFGIWWCGIVHDIHKFTCTELYESAKYIIVIDIFYKRYTHKYSIT